MQPLDGKEAIKVKLIMKDAISWLKRRAKEKEQRELMKQRYLEERNEISNGMRYIKWLEFFLKRLSVIDEDVSVIAVDWSDHEEWQYKCYRNRVTAREHNKAIDKLVNS